MKIPEVHIDNKLHIPIDKFREMDYLSIDEFSIPIELMMENAGLQLARLVAQSSPGNGNVLVAVGTGNNGGGGLVAARRLAAWGFKVFLDIPDKKLHELPQLQLKRALSFGVVAESIHNPDVYVDAYLGFSQRLPLAEHLQVAVEKANKLKCVKLSLDLPTGFNKLTADCIFKPDAILTLAAMKTELLPLLDNCDIYVADLGLPLKVYQQFDIEQPDGFRASRIVKIVR